MPNALNGEVSLPAGGETLTLRFSIDALMALEEDLDLSAAEVVATLASRPKLRLIRTVLRHGLAEHHGALDDARLNAILRETGVPGAVVPLINAFAAAFPKPVEGEAAAEADPPKAAGIGSAASQPGSSSASAT